MVRENIAELTKFCKERSQGALRMVFSYTEDGGTIVYAREDVRGAYADDGFEELCDAAWDVHTSVLEQEPRIETIGEYRVTIHTFEAAFVMQFRESHDEGVAVVFDRQIGPGLHDFLLECEAYLGGETS